MTTPICTECGCFITGKAHRDYDNHHEKKYLCGGCWQEQQDQILTAE